MTEVRHDSYCGLYCGACDVLRTCERGLEAGRTPAWDELPARFG